MVSDTLQIAICGDMPDMTGRLACREDIRYCLFQDSWVCGTGCWTIRPNPLTSRWWSLPEARGCTRSISERPEMTARCFW